MATFFPPGGKPRLMARSVAAGTRRVDDLDARACARLRALAPRNCPASEKPLAQAATVPLAATPKHDGETSCMTTLASSPPAGHLLSLAAVIATSTIFGLTYSLSAALIALDLAERGAEKSVIGLNAAMHALGVLAIALVLPRLVPRIGPRNMTLAALFLASVVLALFPVMPEVWLWFPLRFLLGAASEALFVLSETWVNQLSDESTRARSMATYIAALSVGFALGPLIL